jgi:hypothetical protein
MWGINLAWRLKYGEGIQGQSRKVASRDWEMRSRKVVFTTLRQLFLPSFASNFMQK